MNGQADRERRVADAWPSLDQRSEAEFLALARTDVGRGREAASPALAALAPHLPRYQRSLGNYARLLVEEDEAAG